MHRHVPASIEIDASTQNDAALEAAAHYGIDLSLLRRRLRLSPLERLRTMEATARAIVRLRAAAIR